MTTRQQVTALLLVGILRASGGLVGHHLGLSCMPPFMSRNKQFTSSSSESVCLMQGNMQCCHITTSCTRYTYVITGLAGLGSSQHRIRYIGMLTGTRSGSACLPLVLVKAPMRALSCLRLPKGPPAMAAPHSPSMSTSHAKNSHGSTAVHAAMA